MYPTWSRYGAVDLESRTTLSVLLEDLVHLFLCVNFVYEGNIFFKCFVCLNIFLSFETQR